MFVHWTLSEVNSQTWLYGHLYYSISLIIRQIFFSFRNSPKDLDPSFKMDLDVLGLFRKDKTCIIVKFHRTHLVICSHSREGKTLSSSRMNTVRDHLS